MERPLAQPLARRRSLVALLAAFSAALAANDCFWVMGPIVGIVSPQEGEVLTHMPLDVELDLIYRADPGTLVVRLNGSDISDLFEIGPLDLETTSRRAAWAEFVWGSAFVLPGQNLLEAEILMHGLPYETQVTFSMEGDPYADAVTSTTIGANGGFNLGAMPGVVLGPPQGSGLLGGSLHSFSLGLSGEIVLAFTDNVIVDGPGVDFTVFENPFFSTGLFEVIDGIFSEAGTVSVSQDGVVWFGFPCAGGVADHPLYPGCAGVYPVLANGETDARHPSVPTYEPPIESFIGQVATAVSVPEGSGGDSFDLADVGLGWARYVRIQAADHVVGPFGATNAGFDLDAVAAVNSAPATDANANGVPDAVE